MNNLKECVKAYEESYNKTLKSMLAQVSVLDLLDMDSEDIAGVKAAIDFIGCYNNLIMEQSEVLAKIEEDIKEIKNSLRK